MAAETVPLLIHELRADLERCGPITGAEISRVYMTGDRFRVCVSVQAVRPMAWSPRFRSRGEAIDYRQGALELLERAT
jgi:hypothetical protein